MEQEPKAKLKVVGAHLTTPDLSPEKQKSSSTVQENQKSSSTVKENQKSSSTIQENAEEQP